MKSLSWRWEPLVSAAIFMAVFAAGPVAAGKEPADPTFFFVSDEIALNKDSIEEICIDKVEQERPGLILTLKPEAGERLHRYTSDHVDGWLILASRDKVILKARIMEPLSGQAPILMLSADTVEDLEDLLQNSFGIKEPQTCQSEEIPD